MKKRDDSSPRRAGNRAYHHGNLPEAMLLASRRLVRRHGVRGFTLADVCRAAGVSVAAPYRHFASREALLAELAARGFEELGRDLSVAATESSDLEDAFARLAAAYLAFARRRSAEYALMFANSAGVLLPSGARTRYGPTAYEDARAPRDPVRRRVHLAHRLGAGVFRSAVEVLEARARTSAERALFAGTRGRETVSAFWAMCHGVASLAAEKHLDRDWSRADVLVERIVRPWLRGTLRGSPRDRR
jgi:AcrR family transcriptional regulator